MPSGSYQDSTRRFVGRLTGHSRPHIDIDLNGEPPSPGFFAASSGDEISGKVRVSAPADTPFDHLEIALIGHIRTYVEKVTTAPVRPRTDYSAQFLKTEQPLDDADYPADRKLLAGEEHAFPFTFVVPEHIVPNPCRHKVVNEQLRQEHSRLPPTLNDPSTIDDDFAPMMTNIFYRIRVSLKKTKGSDPSRLETLSDTMKNIRIVPASEEQPPLTIEPGSKDKYRMRDERLVKKGLLKSKTGRLVVEAPQPKDLRLSPPSSSSNEQTSRPTTTATVMVRFDPNDGNSEPPHLENLTSRLRVLTHYGFEPFHDYPPFETLMQDPYRGVFHEKLTLANHGLSGGANVEWQKHSPDSDPNAIPFRRGSSLDPSSVLRCPTSSEQRKANLPFYTTQLQIPIIAPSDNIPRTQGSKTDRKAKKLLVPTFHSCFISRTYVLEMELSYAATSKPDSGKRASALDRDSIKLKVPLQISSKTAATGSYLNQGSSRNSSVEAAELYGGSPVGSPASRRSSGNDENLMEEGRIDYPAPPPEYTAGPTIIPRPRTGGILQANHADRWHTGMPGYFMIR